MINQMTERLYGVGLLVLNPSRLIDAFLDCIERLSDALMTSQTSKSLCEQIREPSQS